MWSGMVDSIHIAPAAKAPTQAVHEITTGCGASLLVPRARFGIVRSSRSAPSSLRVLLDGAV